MTTGQHTVVDISCRKCQINLGWKYLYAFEQTQKYKEGKYILEKARIIKVDGGLQALNNNNHYSDDDDDDDESDDD